MVHIDLKDRKKLEKISFKYDVFPVARLEVFSALKSQSLQNMAHESGEHKYIIHIPKNLFKKKFSNIFDLRKSVPFN